MKKIFIILVLLLLVCGCSEAQNTSDAKLSNDYDTVYFKYDGKNYTKNEVFQRIKAQTVSNTLEPIIAYQTLNAEGFDFESKKAAYEEQYDYVTQMYGEEMVVQYYGTKEDFVKSCYMNDSINLYFTNYVDKRIQDFISEYPTYYVEYITTSDKKKADKFQKLVAKKSTFDEAFEKAEFENGEYVQTLVINADGSSFPEDLADSFKELEVGTVSKTLESVTTTEADPNVENSEPTTTTTYYVIRIISNDPQNEYKDEFISYAIQQKGYQSIFQILNEDHTVNIYDDDFMYTYNQISSTYAPAQ